MKHGTRLGPYEVLEQLGAGGMGEVWLAQDTRLGRKVAVKVLPEAFASDPERLARFEQEARAAAALNHPHIAAVYDVGHEGGVHFMVQEHLQGHTLRTVLDQGRMPLPTALKTAIEIGEALGAAHAAGIVHRDLKPENVFVTPDGHAKILDFGLAKLTEIAAAGPGSASLSPTVLGTVAGQIMGTAGYLAPEQIDGTGVDHRADVFAFGCVLYELTAGRRAFQGKNMIETLDRVANREPEELATIDDALPAELARILSKSLAKSPASRYQSAGDMVVDLRSLVGGVESGKAASIADAAAGGAVAARPSLALVAGVAAVALIAGALGGAWLARPEPEPPRLMHFEFDIPSNDGFSRSGRRVLAISPDGSRVAFTDNDELQLRSLDDPALVAVRGITDPSSPNFSPDGEWVAFWSDGELRKIPIEGGSFVRLAAMPHPHGMRWHPDGGILAAVSGGEGQGGRIVRVDGDGGEPEVVVQLEPGEETQGPILLPGGDWLVFVTKDANAPWSQGAIVAQSLSSGERRLLVENAQEPRVVDSRALTFARDGSLFAVPFDIDRAEVTGGAVPMLEGVSMAPTGGAYYDVSERGDLAFGSGGENAADARLAWFDREGRMELLPLDAFSFEEVALSPDAERAAVTVESASSSRIGIVEIARGTLQTLAEAPASNYRTPQWSPDGRWVYFADSAGVYRARSDFSGEIETVAEGIPSPRLGPFSRDGARATVYAMSGSGRSIYLMDAESGALEAIEEGIGFAELSPDGGLLAYVDWEDTYFRVYVLDLETGQRQVASADAADDPVWSPDGRTLYFMHYPSQMLYSVEVAREPRLAIGEPRTLFRHPSPRNNEIDVAPDGDRFLTLVPANIATGDSAVPESRIRIHVITGWANEVVRRVKPR